jgi:hypothetical protein
MHVQVFKDYVPGPPKGTAQMFQVHNFGDCDVGKIFVEVLGKYQAPVAHVSLITATFASIASAAQQRPSIDF